MLVDIVENADTYLGAPKGWTPETSGPCGTLPIRHEVQGDQMTMTSAWLPTPEELAALNNGGKVYLRVVGSGHPPVWLYALGPGA